MRTVPPRRHHPGATVTRRVGIGVAAVAIASVAAASVAAGSAADQDSPAARRARPTGEVTRRDLVARDTFDGTLGFDDSRTLTAGASGTVTWLTREGSAVRRG